ncbi:MAG: host attachment protein [Chlamydiales bacterium]|nr:host attachment protein [Chlamydiales bacterium]
MRKVWIITANRCKAKVFRAENTHKLVEIKTVEHKEAHEHARDLNADRQGRNNNRLGYGVDTMEAKTSVEEKDAVQFAMELAHMLHEGYKAGFFERLYLIANPPFVSILRDALPKQVASLVEKEVHKDLTHSKGEEVREYLPPVL